VLIAVEAAADTFVRRMASTGNDDIVLAVLGPPDQRYCRRDSSNVKKLSA